jgi:hypothetical protein
MAQLSIVQLTLAQHRLKLKSDLQASGKMAATRANKIFILKLFSCGETEQ